MKTLKKYFVIEDYPALANFGVVICYFVPILGPVFFTLVFRSKFEYIREQGAEIVLKAVIVQIKLLFIAAALIFVFSSC